jgi:hypothetical protein
MKTCRVCQWQEGNESIVSVTWSNAEEDLCSVCAKALEAIATWAAEAWKPNIFRLSSEALAVIPFEALHANLPAPMAVAPPVPEPPIAKAVDVPPALDIVPETTPLPEPPAAPPAKPENWENTK